jgi:hypothetical protein
MNSPEARPKLSVVVVCYEIAGQIKNTLRFLLPPYQRNIATEDYEVTLIENGSTRMLPVRAARAPALRIPLSEYENIRVGALKA